MTRKFNVLYTCQHCGKQTTAETGFGRWMRDHPALDSASGIVRTDTDHSILRYKTHKQGRDFQLILDVEVKEFGKDPDAAQKDILLFKHQIANKTGRNMHDAVTRWTHNLKSFITGRRVKVRYLGFHLLQFEKTNPVDSAWIKWDHRRIDEESLVKLLAIEIDPYTFNPIEECLRDRHAKKARPLFEIDHGRPPR